MTKRLFVGGLPYNLTQDELKTIFEKVGALSTCDIITDKFTNQSKGFAFVEMENDSDGDKAIKTLDGTEIGGRKIVVNVAKPREERSSGYNGNNYQSYNGNNGKYPRNDHGRGFKRY